MNIHAIQTGTVVVKELQRAGRGRGPFRLARTITGREWTPPLPILAWVIEHPEGLIVIDTGETAEVSRSGYFPGWHPYYRMGVREWVRPEEEIGFGLSSAGLSTRDVRWLVLTHLHTDHAGGLHHFPHTEILVSREEFRNAGGFTGKMKGYLPHRWPSWFEPHPVDFQDRPFGPFPRSVPLTRAEDVCLVATPGHTPGHMSVVLSDGDTTFFFAGDTSYTEQLMLEARPDGVGLDPELTGRTLARIRQLAGETRLVYLPSHDPASADRLASRSVCAVKESAHVIASR